MVKAHAVMMAGYGCVDKVVIKEGRSGNRRKGDKEEQLDECGNVKGYKLMVMHARPPALVIVEISKDAKHIIEKKVIDNASELMNCQPIITCKGKGVTWQIQANRVKFVRDITHKSYKIMTIHVPFVFCTSIAMTDDNLLLIKDDRLHIFSTKSLKKTIIIKLNHETSYPFSISTSIHRIRTPSYIPLCHSTHTTNTSVKSIDTHRRSFMAVLDSAQFRYPSVIINTAWLSLLTRSVELSNHRTITMRSTLDNSKYQYDNSIQICYDAC